MSNEKIEGAIGFQGPGMAPEPFVARPQEVRPPYAACCERPYTHTHNSICGHATTSTLGICDPCSDKAGWVGMHDCSNKHEVDGGAFILRRCVNLHGPDGDGYSTWLCAECLRSYLAKVEEPNPCQKCGKVGGRVFTIKEQYGSWSYWYCPYCAVTANPPRGLLIRLGMPCTQEHHETLKAGTLDHFLQNVEYLGVQGDSTEYLILGNCKCGSTISYSVGKVTLAEARAMAEHAAGGPRP